LDPNAEKELQNLFDIIAGFRKQSHHTPHEYPKAVATFVRIYESGTFVHPDDVKHMAEEQGWSKEDARDLGEMADTVYHTLKQVGRI
jgi:1,6-anhydro-N-acetylmuramate kinase